MASHTDIEAILHRSRYTLGDTFNDEKGSCSAGMGATEGRNSVHEPHEPSGQIYRFISNE